MMNFSGQNRGFAYAKYSSSALATEAICMLDGYMLEPGSFIKVCQSIEKRHLCIEELPATTRQEDLLKVQGHRVTLVHLQIVFVVKWYLYSPYS